jgi:hypothetical protein
MVDWMAGLEAEAELPRSSGSLIGRPFLAQSVSKRAPRPVIGKLDSSDRSVLAW